MDITATLALAGGAAWASGLNLYATLLIFGLLGASGMLALPPDLEILSHPLVIAAAGFMYCVEFFADKTPGVDTAWDGLHTFVRIPAGAVLAAAAVGELEPAVQMAAFLVGGGLAAGSHVAKAGTRVLINTSPEPVSNWIASLGEDALVVAGLWTALHYPWLFLALLVVFVAVLAWALPRLFRALRQLGGRMRRWFRRPPLRPGGGTEPPPLALGSPRE